MVLSENVDKIVLYGLGLINGSVGRALRAHGYAGSIVGSGRRAESLERALELGAIDGYTLDEKGAAEDADVVVGTPVGLIPDVVARLFRIAPDDAMFSDVGCVKGGALRRRRVRPDADG